MNIPYGRVCYLWRSRSERPLRAITWVILVLVSAGCQEEEQSGVEVRICGDLVVPDEIDSIRLTVYNEDRSEAWSGLMNVGEAEQEPKQPDDSPP